MYREDIDQLIELIYEAATEPSKWADLLNALAELVERAENQPNIEYSEQNILAEIPNNKESNVSISETLKSITNIDQEEIGNRHTDIGGINDLLMRHFAQAIKIAKRIIDIDEQHNVVLSLLDRMPIALVLVNAKSEVIETNALADEIFSSEEGLKVKSNVLNSGTGNNKRLLEAVEKMSKHDADITRGQTLSITNEKTNNNIMLFFAPLKQQDSSQQASVAIFISQRKKHLISLPKEMSELYGLTDKELEIAEQLVRGLSVKTITEESTASYHTVRTHVKAVLNKTGTTRQAELVSLVYNGMSDFVNSIPENSQGKREGLLSNKKVWQSNYKILKLDDGRNLAYSEYGDLNGAPVFHCHSVLGSRQELSFNAPQISEKKAVRLIIMDRPGYGASDPDPKTSFISWTKDLVQLANHLNIENFTLTGYSLGGIYALACAHEIPKRLKQVVIISSGTAPDKVSDYEKIIPMYKMNYRLAKYMPKVYKLLSSVLVKGVLSDPEAFFKQFKSKLDQADQDILNSEEYKEQIFSSLREGFRQGGKASSNDVVKLVHDWSFKLSDITIPITFWHGTSDYHTPLVLSERLVKNTKNPRHVIKEGEGHYMFYTHWSEILDAMF